MDLTADSTESLVPFYQNMELGGLTDIINPDGDVADVSINVQERLNLDFAIDFDYVDPANSIAIHGNEDLIPDGEDVSTVNMNPGPLSFKLNLEGYDAVLVEVADDGERSLGQILIDLNAAISATDYNGLVLATLVCDRLSFELANEVAGNEVSLTADSSSSMISMFGFWGSGAKIVGGTDIVVDSTADAVMLNPGPMEFELTLGSEDPVVITLVDADGDRSFSEIVNDLNVELAQSDYAGQVYARVIDGSLGFVLSDDVATSNLEFSTAADSSLLTVFGFGVNQADRKSVV